jgi:hypothetical protein
MGTSKIHQHLERRKRKHLQELLGPHFQQTHLPTQHHPTQHNQHGSIIPIPHLLLPTQHQIHLPSNKILHLTLSMILPHSQNHNPHGLLILKPHNLLHIAAAAATSHHRIKYGSVFLIFHSSIWKYSFLAEFITTRGRFTT